MSLVGSTIENIRIDSLLGTGGMGEVYLGFDKRLERRVAVKTIRPEQRLSRRLKARFLREARLLSKLGHPAICQVYDLIETPGADFLVLEYVEGKTLGTLAAEGSLSFDDKLRLAEKIAAALAVAHRERIVHRDLKADNIMVTPEGEVKVLDFGVARSLSEEQDANGDDATPPPEAANATVPLRLDSTWWLGRPVRREPPELTRHGWVVGTVSAMSPEQAAGARVTEASDLYSFGILLQELFTGEPAYIESGALDVMSQVVQARTRPIRPGLEPDLTALILELQSLDPNRRPSAGETGRRLAWLRDKPQRERRKLLRRRAVAGAFALLLVVLAVVSALAVAAHRARREADRRRQQAEGLISFMIGDLRPKLEAVGRLDIIESVGDRALTYFDALPEGQLTDEELYQRVLAIRQIGEVRREQGDLPAAKTAFARAIALGRDLVKRDPAREEWQEAFISSESWLGQALYEQGDTAAALTTWQSTLDRSHRLLAAHPDSFRLQNLVALASHNVGTVLEVRGDPEGALRAYQESLALKGKLAAARPQDLQWQIEHAETLGWVSQARERLGDLSGALRDRRLYLASQERLVAADPQNTARLRDLAVAQGFLAGLLAVLGDLPAARSLYATGLATIEELAAGDPANSELERWRGAFLSGLGRLAVEQGDPTTALPLLARACRLLDGLLVKDVTNSDWRLQLGVCHSRTADARSAGDPARARAEALRALDLLRPLLQAEPDDGLRGHAAEAEVILGRAEEGLGRTRESRAAWERALAVLGSSQTAPADWKLLAPRTQALLSLDQLDEARPGVERLMQMGFRSRSFLELARRKGVLPAEGL